VNPLLLDTNALLWYLLQPALLSAPAQQAIQAAPALAVSAGTVWEVATKHRIGRLPEVGPLVAHGLLAALAAQAIAVLPISGPDAERAGSHPVAHRDPFDRMLAAQAILRGLSVVSSDPQLGALGAARVW
jgi:PIN domain nuclease of toxin-antitoxin system